MEQPPDPYQTPAAGAAAPAGMPPQRSAIPKVFGILHIIYASIGGLVALFGLGAGAILSAATDTIKTEAEKEGQDVSAFTEALDSMMTASMIQSAFSILFAILLLVAGIQLVRYKKSGGKLSTIWAIARIVVAIPVSFMAASAQTKFQDAIQDLNPEGAALDMSAFAGAGAVIGIILVSIYPILTLIFVNQAKAKESLT